MHQEKKILKEKRGKGWKENSTDSWVMLKRCSWEGESALAEWMRNQ